MCIQYINIYKIIWNLTHHSLTGQGKSHNNVFNIFYFRKSFGIEQRRGDVAISQGPTVHQV